MRTSVRRTLCATAIAGGFTVLGIAFATSSASAAETPNVTSGADALASGNQTGGQSTAPVDASGNQVSVAGDNNTAGSTDQGGGSGSTASSGPSSSSQSTSGAGGTGSGNQTDAGAAAPVDASDNQVTVLGDGNTNDNAGSGNGAGSASSGGGTTSGAAGDGSGNQTDAQATAPVSTSGNQVTVLGDGNTADVQRGDDGVQPATTGPDSTGGAASTDGQDGTGSGNQTDAGIGAPVDASGNQVTVLGDGNTSTAGSSSGSNGAGSNGETTDGQDGTVAGNQTAPALTAPVDGTGNQVTVLGDGNTAETTRDGTTTDGSGGSTTDGQDGTGSGNQTAPAVVAPVRAGDNQVNVLADGNTTERIDPAPGTSPEQGAGSDGSGSDENGTGSGGVFDSDPGPGPGAGGATSAPQGGPVAEVAGALPRAGLAMTGLPQTGVAAGLALWGSLGLGTLLLGLVLLLAGQRRRAVAVVGAREAVC